MNKARLPKVSVIIPTYNVEKHIRRCISSVLNQEYANIEIIIVDDGSTDGTLDVVSTFEDNRIMLFGQKHLGVSAARNVGIEKSSGEYIMFIDSDDALRDDAIGKLVKYIRAENVDVVKFNYYDFVNGEKKRKGDLLDLAGKTLNTKLRSDLKILLDRFFIDKKTIPCYSVTLFFKREHILKNRLAFDDNLYIMEDAVFYLDLIENGAKIYFVDEPFYYYYANNDSVTHSRKDILRTVSGFIESTTIIIDRLGYNQNVAAKYFKIIFENISRYICVENKVDDMFFCGKIKKIASIVSEKNEKSWKKIYWRLAKESILGDKHILMRLLSYIYKVRAKVGRLTW